MMNNCNCPGCQHYRRLMEAKRVRSSQDRKDTAWVATLCVLLAIGCLVLFFEPELTKWWEALR